MLMMLPLVQDLKCACIFYTGSAREKKSGPLEDEKINLQLEEWLDIALSYWALSMGVVTVEFLLTFVW